MTKNRLRQIQPQQEQGKAGPTCPFLLCWVAGTVPEIGFYFSLIFLNLLMVPTDINSSENFHPVVLQAPLLEAADALVQLWRQLQGFPRTR